MSDGKPDPGERAVYVLEPPPAAELVDIVADFLQEEVYPLDLHADVRLRVRIAVNVLRLAKRELALAGQFAVDEDGFLVTPDLLERGGSLRSLADELRSGAKSLVDPEIYGILRRYTEAKMRVAAPDEL